jgi:ATP-GRASP peptide maturase of grasp-with-spasm system
MNKVLIISNEDDHTTNLVIDWLRYYKQEYIRINDTTHLTVGDFLISNQDTDFTLSNENFSIRYSEIKSVWYRRGFLNISKKTLKARYPNEVGIDALSIYLSQEYEHFNHSIIRMLWQKFCINSSSDIFTNKISNLQAAKSVGLNVPKTIVTNQKSKIIDFVRSCTNGAITKAMYYGTFISVDTSMSLYTNEVSFDDIDLLSDTFWPCLLQEKLDKYIELRIFYIHGKCYSEAIFSQNDSKTSVDFRRYNYKNPNRTPPFILPQKIEMKLKQFMNSINMNCGSIDMVLTTNYDYYFLEVNPVGQFQQVSYPCNYQLERVVAKQLINTYEDK